MRKYVFSKLGWLLIVGFSLTFVKVLLTGTVLIVEIDEKTHKQV